MAESKSFMGVQFKAAHPAGMLDAVFSTFGVEDLDGDLTLPGAFENGAEVMVSAWQHGSWNAGMLPIGKAVIRSDGYKAWFESQLNMELQTARDTSSAIRDLGPLARFSYGYDVLDSEIADFNGKRLRFLKQVKVHEVSPVMIAAGVGTRTLVAKSDDADAIYRDWVAAHGLNMAAELERSRFLLSELVNN